MNRLQSELHRLYLMPGPVPGAEDGNDCLVDTAGRVRAMVLELRRPASWELLARVWKGVQTEWAWPAPGIAVSGTDALQLWFALALPISTGEARAALGSMRERFLSEVDPRRIGLLPNPDVPATDPARHARLVPAVQTATGNWSAFVTPDLAAVFADTPWLDIPPGEENQAALLRTLALTTRPAFDAALERPGSVSPPPSAAAPGPALPPSPTSADVDPRQFLQRVLNDESVALALRIDAARALLSRPAQTRPS